MFGRGSFLILFAIVLSSAILLDWRRTPRAAGQLSHEFYVWQRAWTSPVVNAVNDTPPTVSGLAPLAAEVTWRNGRAEVAWPQIDFAALRRRECHVSAVMRIAECQPGRPDEVCAIARQIAHRFTAELPSLAELQVDFDCAQSQLAGYRGWLAALRAAVAPLPVRPTVLPSWLSATSFSELARESGGYILQVHATHRPRVDAPETALCDMRQAHEWVERAGKIGVPFRVALPTYTYVVAFAPDGNVLGIVAEGESPVWPEGTTLRAFRPDAAQIAALIAGWEKDRPAALRSVIWYRLPVSSDTLNWSWATLNAVLAGRAPRSDLRVEQTGVSPVDVTLFNAGEAEEAFPRELHVEADHGDAIGGYETEARRGEVVFQRTPGLEIARIRPGARHAIGWVHRQTGAPTHALH